MSELIPINIVIADRTYRIKTLPKDEEVIRKTVKLINDKVIEFKNLYAGKDMQDYLAMVIIWHATHTTGAGNNEVQQKEFKEGLAKISNLLESF